MQYDRLDPDARRSMVDERIRKREEEHFLATLELAEAVGNPSERTFQENVDDLAAKIEALKSERSKIADRSD